MPKLYRLQQRCSPGSLVSPKRPWPRLCLHWSFHKSVPSAFPSSRARSSSASRPSPISINHDSLSSFLAHAARTGLSRSSTTFVGTYYEYLCLQALRRFGFVLQRVGGRSDAGIDLIGEWRLPSAIPSSSFSSSSSTPTSPPAATSLSSSPQPLVASLTSTAATGTAFPPTTPDPNADTQLPLPPPSSHPLPIHRSSSRIQEPLRCVVQCKALSRRAGPSLVRELEGAFAGAPAGWRGSEVVGVLCAPRGATKGVREAVRRAGRGLVWVCVEHDGGAGDSAGAEGRGRGERGDGAKEEENEEPRSRGEEGQIASSGLVKQMLWNERVSELGAEGVGVSMRHVPGGGAVGVSSEVVLTWRGVPWEPDWRDSM